MSRAKITLTFEMEYDLVENFYDKEHDTDEKRLEVDLESAKNDFGLFLDSGLLKLVDIKGGIVEEPSDNGSDDSDDTIVEK